MKKLNCINSQWNWTNCENCFTIFGRIFLRFALSFIVFKLYFMSLVSGNNIEHVPSPKIPKHLQIIITFIKNMYWMHTPITYLAGLFISNGSLWKKKRKKFWNLRIKFQFYENHNANFYHMGSGNSKADSPTSVVKYLMKLTIIPGHIHSTEVTLIKAKCSVLSRFSNFWPDLVYSACSLWCLDPRIQHYFCWISKFDCLLDTTYYTHLLGLCQPGYSRIQIISTFSIQWFHRPYQM